MVNPDKTAFPPVAQSRSNRRTAKRIAPVLAQVPGLRYGVLDELVGYALRRAQLRIYQDFDEAVQAWGITPPRFAALTLICHNPDLKLTDLAYAMGIARSGAVEVVNALEAQGYVRRDPCATDARAYVLSLTSEGKVAYQQMEGAVRAHDRHISAVLTPKEQLELIRLLGKLGQSTSL